MSESRTFVFPENGNSGGGTNGILAMLPALMQQRGVDPNILALMGNGNNRNGNGWGDDLFAILLLFILMGWGGMGGFGGARGGMMGNGQGGVVPFVQNDANTAVIMQAVQRNGYDIQSLATALNTSSDAVQAAGGRFVDVRQTLTAHKDEYIYYRTDHHWTSTGAYYAYKLLCDTLGLTPFDTAAHTVLTADGFYGTHYSKARTPDAEPDTITYYDLPNELTIYSVSGPGQPADGETTGLYDTAKLDVYDKYAMFLHGNNGLSRIKGDGTGRILVIKDSYANCFVPYLTANYADIDVVDFRNYNYGLDKLIADNDYDQLLVLYSFDSFKSDPYLYRAGVAG